MIDPNAAKAPQTIEQLQLRLQLVLDELSLMDILLDVIEQDYHELPDGTLVRRWTAATNNAPSWP